MCGSKEANCTVKSTAYAIFARKKMRKKIRKNGGNEGNSNTLADCVAYLCLTVDKDKPLGLLGCCGACGVVVWCPRMVPFL